MESRIIARQKEIRILKDCFASDQSDFIAIYGRRRIGKTFLIRELFEDKLAFLVKILSNKALLTTAAPAMHWLIWRTTVLSAPIEPLAKRNVASSIRLSTLSSFSICVLTANAMLIVSSFGYNSA